MLEHTQSSEEHSQILQTIDMFEVITQTQHDDYQSLEILKEAYQKVGREQEVMRISRKLAEAYFNVGSYTLAMQECESLLLKEPNAPEILAMLGDIENKLQSGGHDFSHAGAENALILPPEPSDAPAIAGENSLIRVSKKSSHAANGDLQFLADRGDDQLAKFIIVQQLFSEEEVNPALEAVKSRNKSLGSQDLAVSLLEELCKGDNTRMELLISALIDRTKFAYVPLEYYDIDRQVVRMLPDHLTVGRLFVPFDLISRTIMIAICNPFDAAGRQAVQQSLDYTVAWYLARPGVISKTLQDVYRLEGRA